MTPDEINRGARQIALPAIGLEGQERIVAATVVVAGDDLACEVVARALGAAGVGRLALLRRTGPLAPAVAGAIAGSNPQVTIETRPWPTAAGAWLPALAQAAVVVRSGFDDDPLLRAALRLGVPVVVMRGREDGIEVLSFRRNGPCPHGALEVPEKAATPAQDGAGAVVAAHLAAAEVLLLLAGATTGTARARHISVGETATRAVDIPWTPECFACGGSGVEMSFS